MGTQVQTQSNGKKVEKAVILPSRYGHRQSSMSGRIDDLVYAGTTEENAVKVLSKEFGKPEKMAKAKFRAHINWLPKVRGVEIELSKTGIYKSKVAHASADMLTYHPFAGKAKKEAKAPKTVKKAKAAKTTAKAA
jgi:hypothetical protein